MNEELQNRFFQQKLQELLTDSTRPFPTMIFEMERPEVIELIRKFCLFSPKMIQYKVRHNLIENPEQLETEQVKDYGELYVLVNPN